MGGLADTDLVVEDDWYVEVSVGEDIIYDGRAQGRRVGLLAVECPS